MEEEENRLPEGVAVLDFDMLCATVALQTQGNNNNNNNNKRTTKEEEEEEEEGEFGGVQRMWEGDVLDCLQDRRIAVQSTCCPCYRFGKNTGRANLGPCLLQGSIYVIFLLVILFDIIAFGATKQHGYLYVGVASAVSFGVYMGYFRTRIRKQFNISGRDSFVDDCVNHLVCPCCTLCQESRTLEMNNVQDGFWHGRGDTICIGSYGEGSKEFSTLYKPSLVPTKSPEVINMARVSNGSNHSQNLDASQLEPLVASGQAGQPP